MAATVSRTPVAENPWGRFSENQAKIYAQNRRSYSQRLYDTVLDFHQETGGGLTSLVDVGCGSGVAVRDLARRFTTAVGFDPSQGMIDTARSLGGSTASGPIRFELCAAEKLEHSLFKDAETAGGGADLIIAANSAHYFNPTQFWAAAARVLKPGGSVAMWFSRPVGMHHSVPNGRAIEESLNALRQAEMERFEKIQATTLGNNTVEFDQDANTFGTYYGVLLPWHETIRNSDFDESTFYHRKWSGRDTDGEVEEFFISQPRFDLDTMEQIMGTTAGSYMEWRKAHPDLAGTDKDLLKRSRREIERLQRQVGVEKGEEWVKSSVFGALMIVKKKI